MVIDSRAPLAAEMGGCEERNWILWLKNPITSAQKLAPNVITSARWHHSYPEYYSFIFMGESTDV